MMVFYLLITKPYVNNKYCKNVKVKYCIFKNRAGNNTLFYISLMYITDTEFLQLLIFQFIDFLNNFDTWLSYVLSINIHSR